MLLRAAPSSRQLTHMPSLLRHRLGSLGSRSLSTLLPTSQRAQDAADAFVHAWVSGEPLSSERFPAAPASVDAMYQTHLAIQQHPLVSTKLGGLGDTRRAPSRQLCQPLPMTFIPLLLQAGTSWAPLAALGSPASTRRSSETTWWRHRDASMAQESSRRLGATKHPAAACVVPAA